MPNINTQTTVNTAAPNTYLNKTFYDRNLLRNAETVFVHQQFGQKRGIPANNGKQVEFRKWTLFDVNTAALELTEGVTPDAQSIAQTKVEATIKQYGAYVTVSDLLDLTAYDPVIGEMTSLLGEQLGTCLDWVTRDAMIADASTQYAGGRAAKNAVTASDKMSVDEIRKAVRTLKKAKARKFTGGGSPHFVCIVDPDVVYDLQGDSAWLDAHKYTDCTPIYNGELGRMYGVVFVESTEGKVDTQTVHNAVNANTSSSTSFVLKNTPTAAEIAFFSTAGNTFKIGTTEYTTVSYAEATKTVTMSTSASLSADDIVWTDDAGAADASTKVAIPVHHSPIFGADAYGVIDIAGKGGIQSIVKPVGSAGTADPLDQRSTVAGKVMAYTAKVLNPLWIIDIISAAS